MLSWQKCFDVSITWCGQKLHLEMWTIRYVQKFNKPKGMIFKDEDNCNNTYDSLVSLFDGFSNILRFSNVILNRN